MLILESVSPGLRGEITRWLLELKPGVFVGTLSAMVRDLLWEKVCNEAADGGCVLVHRAANEQGFAIRMEGRTSKVVEDFEGLLLMRVPE
ncbi:type I-E CRISPR-associated endoribonuclease Cas2e [Limnochorda pilosa]|uniref:type I-E CRISPR-associated endoribonuclease Cas2e n=1 Tax=Limnochorda pilosa TaxID=1555112 RepID=UPI0018E0B919|nr:type I-E CRISPR-associated endoribonuclease Cas2e [Limnochorda pilosa]